MAGPRRIRITLAYDGTGFHGWQVQPGLPTIQGVLEEIIGSIEKKPVHVAGSGRTDAGVHALAQVAAFTLENPIPPNNLRKAINRLLPPAIRVLTVDEVHPDFHPRYDATAKTYQYRIHRGEIVPPFDWRYTHHFPYPLNEQAIAGLTPLLQGTRDFFVAAPPRRRPPDLHGPGQRLPEAHGSQYSRRVDRSRKGKSQRSGSTRNAGRKLSTTHDQPPTNRPRQGALPYRRRVQWYPA